MKLISMVEFVLQVVNSDRPCDRGKMLDEIGNYAEFLKQPLKLEMFIPCDDEGNVLKELIYSDQVHIYLNYHEKQYYVKRCNDYKKSKEKVLFEGFEGYDLKTILFKYRSIESLQCFFNNIELTENAVKQIGL